jgi:hypothetical protein
MKFSGRAAESNLYGVVLDFMKLPKVKVWDAPAPTDLLTDMSCLDASNSAIRSRVPRCNYIHHSGCRECNLEQSRRCRSVVSTN